MVCGEGGVIKVSLLGLDNPTVVFDVFDVFDVFVVFVVFDD